jgi:regulation of enolase protein 1 (concanavalin A-like superfamily)
MRLFHRGVRFPAAFVALASLTAFGFAKPSLPAPVASYSTSFTLAENPISEGGVWSNNGLDWTTVQTENGYAHGTQPGTGAYTDSYAYLSGFTADQEAQAIVFHDPSKTGGTQEVELLLRWADSAHVARGYECNFSYGGGYAEIVRWNGPLSSFTYLARVSLGRALVTGDAVKAQIVGNVITVYFNGNQINQATDSTWTTGQPGMAFWKGSSGGPNTALGFSSYTATSLGIGFPVSPAISTQPASQSVTAGQTATFSVTATGTAPLSYQWQKAGANISGAMSSSYITPATTMADNGSSYRVIVTNTAGSVTSNSASLTVNPGTSTLPIPWLDQDVGATGVPGTASYSSGSFTLRGSGTDIWGTADAFHFVYQTLNGDGEIIAQVAGLGSTDPWAKAGVMIRETLTAGSANAAMVVTPGNGTAFQRRTATGGTSATTAGPAATVPDWVRLVRSGNTFTAYASPDGSTWTSVGTDAIPMAASVYIGLVVTSHSNTVLNTAMVDSVRGSGGWQPSSGGGGTPPPAPSGGGGGGGGCGATGMECVLLLSLLSMIRKRRR